LLLAGGELNALTALVDDEGVDLGLKRRNGSKLLMRPLEPTVLDEIQRIYSRSSSRDTLARSLASRPLVF
jgi:hypothetical protein